MSFMNIHKYKYAYHRSNSLLSIFAESGSAIVHSTSIVVGLPKSSYFICVIFVKVVLTSYN